ncbi:universal stress protein [Alicyclobacillaceae bacterium I2511]|nr:universal stress protein [Alicyclobacillaceae bacterium I2511]
MNKILFATDGSNYSKKAHPVIEALLTKWPDVQVIVLYVSPTTLLPTDNKSPRTKEPEVNFAQDIEEETLAVFKPWEHQVRFQTVAGPPTLTICDVANRESVDLIVVGSHGKGAFDRLVLGSVSHGVLNRAKMSVLVVK